MTNTATLTYLGKEFTEVVLTAEEVGSDRIVQLNNYEISVQGYEQCYNETRRFHFLITRKELAKIS